MGGGEFCSISFIHNPFPSMKSAFLQIDPVTRLHRFDWTVLKLQSPQATFSWLSSKWTGQSSLFGARRGFFLGKGFAAVPVSIFSLPSARFLQNLSLKSGVLSFVCFDVSSKIAFPSGVGMMAIKERFLSVPLLLRWFGIVLLEVNCGISDPFGDELSEEENDVWCGVFGGRESVQTGWKYRNGGNGRRLERKPAHW